MDCNFYIVLFKNRVRKKIVKSFKTSKRCISFYNNLIEKSDSVLFEKKTENGRGCEYELAILEKKNPTLFSLYSTDEYGRNIKIELEDNNFTISKIKRFKIDDKIYDYQTKKKIVTSVLIQKYLNKDGLKLVSKLNNKILIQQEEKCYLFTFKNESDSTRFIESVSSFFMGIKRYDCIFVKDTSTAQRKYLYEYLIHQGYPKDYLYRKVTTFGVKK